jgi:small-conductance mechanosensitive channel
MENAMLRAGLMPLLLSLFWVFSATHGLAQQQAAATLPPDKIADLVRVLNDPEIRAWADAQAKNATAKTPALQPAANRSRTAVEIWEAGARANVHMLIDALPALPAALVTAIGRIRAEAHDKGFMSVTGTFAAILGACLLAEFLARRAMRHVGRDNPLITRTYVESVPLATFTIVAAIAFLSVDWPPLMHTTILFYLLAVVAFRFIGAITALALSAGSLSLFMMRRLLLFTGLLLIAIATSATARLVDMPDEVNYAGFFLTTILLVAICCEAIWRRPDTDQTIRSRLLLIFYVIGLWLIWIIGLHMLFWLGVYAAVMPRLLPSVDRMTKAFAATRWPDFPEASIPTVMIVRGVRALIIAAAVAWLALVWQFNPRDPGRYDTLITVIVLGLIKSVIVLLIADLGWSLARALINRKLATVGESMQLASEEQARRARLRTLLPIFRNALAALILVIAGLTVLAEMGVEIGPLVAGAGIFGVAIGFGSQTLVKDVISGIFYLMDDAFRIGEYIQSGSYKGTVESFSLRSVRLRHHRGPVFTVPFGELGAVQNLSRDWAIDKFLLRVGFDTDIVKAKKLVKTIGTQLNDDEELGPMIIETLKMKGVEQIGDFGIELAFAFTSVPGWQSMIRRRAYAMIREAFTENGISFSQPTVHVGGDDRSDAAAAAHMLGKQRSAEAMAAQQQGSD